MEKQDYIQLFDKFLLKQASPEEVQILIQWLKSEGSFQDWMDEEWDVASSGMDTDLQQKLLGQIKQKISLEMQQAPLKRSYNLSMDCPHSFCYNTFIIDRNLSLSLCYGTAEDARYDCLGRKRAKSKCCTS